MMNLKKIHFCSTLLSLLLLSACDEQSTFAQRNTLQSIDIDTKAIKIEEKQITLTASENDIRDAYVNYLKHSSKGDLSRSTALNRLASIEFELSEKFLYETQDEDIATQRSEQKLNHVIDLLETSLNDYPDAKYSDVSLYQLAKAYDQKGLYEETHSALQQLVDKYPKSNFYTEAQFRLAEYAFTQRQYLTAEDKYSEVINAKKNSFFYEKALYKRGWSRFKQQFYLEAADDFVKVINLNKFSEYEQLNDTTKNLFNEYFRALALSFSYLDGAQTLSAYLQDSQYEGNEYYIYRSLSAVFLKQQQYNDAVDTLTNFIEHYPESVFVPQSSLKTIEIWKEAGFITKRNLAFEHFYQHYNPNSDYWKNKKELDKSVQNKINASLKSKILTETATYHKRYQKSKKQQDFQHAQRWYQYYLTDFPLYARQDNIHLLLASLYNEHGDIKDAAKYYQLAGFDEETIINKDAAYQSILLISSLYTDSQHKTDQGSWLSKLIHYSTLYAQQYPTAKQSLKIIAHASSLAYQNKQYDDAIRLVELAISAQPSKLMNEITRTKAHAYFYNKQYELAEVIYLDLINNSSLSQQDKKAAREGLSLAIFYQGNEALEKKQKLQAIEHYARIMTVAPETQAASSGLYDAIALSIEHEKWLLAISYIQSFRKLYPKHKYATDVTKKLSVAYLNSEQDVEAAKELEKLSSKDDSREYKMASLLKAAQLYQKNNKNEAAIRSYSKYVKHYKKPFMAYQESLYQLSLLNKNKSLTWFKNIVAEDKKTPNSAKNNRTNFIASTATIALAREQHAAFSRVKLIQPLKKHLKRKKQTMQASVNLYAKASSFGIVETATEATYAIAHIYNDFSQALLNSEIPKHLDEDEQEEYVFLLEDQAFPFEEKAIEFYEINLNYSNDDIYDKWLANSLKELQKLFPVRYQREAKLEGVINVLH